MSGHIIPIISRFDEALNKKALEELPDISKKYKLSIQLSLDGFSFCIFNSERNKYLAIESYNFQRTGSYINLCKYIDELFLQLSWLKKSFQSVNIIFENNKSTLVPFPLFDESEKDIYLNFNHTITNDEQIVYDKLNTLEAYNIFSLPICLNNKLKDIFPDCKISHFSSTLIESILIKYKNQPVIKRAFINVRNLYLDIIITEGKRQIFYNSFKYRTEEDFIYFLIFVLEQLQLNPEDIDLILIGQIEKKSALFEMIYKYVRNIRFEDRNNIFQYSYIFNDIPSHFYYNLLNINLCEL